MINLQQFTGGWGGIGGLGQCLKAQLVDLSNLRGRGAGGWLSWSGCSTGLSRVKRGIGLVLGPLPEQTEVMGAGLRSNGVRAVSWVSKRSWFVKLQVNGAAGS